LYEAQNTISQLDVKREQLEGENQELLLRKEQLQNEIQRLHAELNVEIEKSARTRDQLQQRFVQLEQDKDFIRQRQQSHHHRVIQQHHLLIYFSMKSTIKMFMAYSMFNVLCTSLILFFF